MKHIGTVKSFRTSNGCGFILSDTGDVFVHVSNILPNEGTPSDVLLPGERVEYTLFESQRGQAASEVRRLAPVVCSPVQGQVRKIFPEKGYGFIASPHGDVFFHFADCLFSDVTEGATVRYLLAYINQRPRAIKVRR